MLFWRSMSVEPPPHLPNHGDQREEHRARERCAIRVYGVL